MMIVHQDISYRVDGRRISYIRNDCSRYIVSNPV